MEDEKDFEASLIDGSRASLTGTICHPRSHLLAEIHWSQNQESEVPVAGPNPQDVK